jgi:hypothetical protein
LLKCWAFSVQVEFINSRSFIYSSKNLTAFAVNFTCNSTILIYKTKKNKNFHQNYSNYCFSPKVRGPGPDQELLGENCGNHRPGKCHVCVGEMCRHHGWS